MVEYSVFYFHDGKNVKYVGDGKDWINAKAHAYYLVKKDCEKRGKLYFKDKVKEMVNE